MANTIILENKHSVSELRSFLKNNKDELMKTRIKILLLVKGTVSRKNISEKLSVHIDTITDVVKRYNAQGLKSLATNKGGRKEGNPKWNTEIFNELIKEIDKQEKYWSIPIMIEWVKEKYGKSIPEQTVWYQLDKRKYTYKSSRPHPYLGNKEEQDSFKKRAWCKA